MPEQAANNRLRWRCRSRRRWRTRPAGRTRCSSASGDGIASFAAATRKRWTCLSPGFPASTRRRLTSASAHFGQGVVSEGADRPPLALGCSGRKGPLMPRKALEKPVHGTKLDNVVPKCNYLVPQHLRCRPGKKELRDHIGSSFGDRVAYFLSH